jgi:hypothetical protein
VIPPDIMARDLMFAAPMNGWRLELKSTNWLGYWIIQLTSESHEVVEMLITFDHLTAICTGMRACIDVADDPSQYPRATTMLQRVAVDLPTQVTQKNTDGAISILSGWEEAPYLNINYYRSSNVDSPAITQALSIEDAHGLYNFFANIYNQFPAKKTWAPRHTPI